MKKHAVRIFMTLSLFSLLAVASVYGQSARTLIVNIPFDFAIGKTTLLAGEYTIRPIRTDLLLIRSADGRRTRLVSTRLVDAGATSDQAKLVFSRSGDQYYLSQISTAGSSVRYELPKSRIERDLAKSRSNHQTVSVVVKQE